jgi:hypothetical protein
MREKGNKSVRGRKPREPPPKKLKLRRERLEENGVVNMVTFGPREITDRQLQIGNYLDSTPNRGREISIN